MNASNGDEIYCQHLNMISSGISYYSLKRITNRPANEKETAGQVILVLKAVLIPG